jgi:hypothetical protein
VGVGSDRAVEKASAEMYQLLSVSPRRRLPPQQVRGHHPRGPFLRGYCPCKDIKSWKAGTPYDRDGNQIKCQIHHLVNHTMTIGPKNVRNDALELDAKQTAKSDIRKLISANQFRAPS